MKPRLDGECGLGIIEALVAAVILVIIIAGVSKMIVSGLESVPLDLKEYIGLMEADSKIEQIICQIQDVKIKKGEEASGSAATTMQGACPVNECTLYWQYHCNNPDFPGVCVIETWVKDNGVTLAYSLTSRVPLQ
jgi:hypothetical protein